MIARLTRTIERDNEGGKLFKVWIGARSAEDATLFVAVLTADRIRAVLGGGKDVVCAVFAPDRCEDVAAYILGLRGTYLGGGRRTS